MHRHILAALLAALLVGLVVAQPKAPALPAINPGNAKLLRTIEALPSPCTGVVVVPGKGLVVVSGEDGALQVWPLAEGKPQANPVGRHLTALAAGKNLIACSSRDGKVHVWTAPTDKPARTLTASAAVRAVAISPDDRWIAAAGDDGTLQLWQASDGAATHKFTGPTDWLLAVDFSQDGKLVAAGGLDGKLWLWELQGNKKRFDVPASPPPAGKEPALSFAVTALSFSPDGKTLAVGTSDGRVSQFDPANGKLLRTLTGHKGAITALTHHPAGNLLLSASKDRSIRLWNPQSGGAIKTLEGHTAWVQGLALAEQGTLALSAGADRTVRIWDLGAAPAKK